jgi:hypothetical protein
VVFPVPVGARIAKDSPKNSLFAQLTWREEGLL